MEETISTLRFSTRMMRVSPESPRGAAWTSVGRQSRAVVEDATNCRRLQRNWQACRELSR